MIKEFKTFMMRGNILDLAVGVIIGGAFGKIVSSIVEDILMPLIGLLLGGVNFAELSFKMNDAIIHYGKFLQSLVDFLIIAACIFLIIKLMNRFVPKKESAVIKTDELKVLEEIRDLLKKKK